MERGWGEKGEESEGEGAAMFREYAQAAERRGRAVHVSHEEAYEAARRTATATKAEQERGGGTQALQGRGAALQ